MQVPAHDDKCTIVKCHPLAEGVVASVGQDHLVKVSCDWLTLVSVLSCDWSDLVRGGHAAPAGGRAGGPRGPGVLAGLVPVRQVPRHLLQGRQDQVRRAISHYHSTATVFRIYDPRASSAPVREGGNVIPKKGSRIVWTNDNLHLLVTGFTKQSERLVNLYTSQDLKQVH